MSSDNKPAAAQEACDYQYRVIVKATGQAGDWSRVDQEWFNKFDGYTDDHYAIERRKLYAAPVAAAPGIDLPGWAFERPSGADVIEISAPNGKTWIAEPDDRLHMLAAAVIDASPKGGSDEDTYLLPALATNKMLEAGWPRGEIIDDTFDRQGAYADLLAAALQATSAEVGA